VAVVDECVLEKKGEGCVMVPNTMTGGTSSLANRSGWVTDATMYLTMM